MRLRLLSSLAVLSLLAGCSRGTPPPSSSSEPGTPAAAEQPATPAGEAPANEPGTASKPSAPVPQGPAVFVVRTSGVRCITEPCPYYVATRPERPGEEALEVHEVDLGAVAATEQAREPLQRALDEGPGLKVEAVVEVKPNAGPAGAATVLRVRKVVP